MKFLKSYLLALFILGSATTFAQKDFGKVTIEDLKQTKHATDTSAVAAILYNIGETRFVYSQTEGFTIRTTVKTRIKIYKKEGYEWANHSKRYFIGDSPKETLEYSDAYTYNLVEGKIVKTKLKSDGEFNENVNRFWARKKIALPNVKEGSIVEFEYHLKSPYYGTLPDWDFQTGVPVNYSEFKIAVPEYFKYAPTQKGYIFPKATTTTSQKSIVISDKERVGTTVVKTVFTNDTYNYMETQTLYVAENLPAMKDEAFVNNINNYISGISHELAMTKMPGSVEKFFTSDWESVTKRIYEGEDFGAELNKTGYFEDNIKVLLNGVTNPEEKIALIFNHVKSSVKWNNFYGYSCNDGVRKAYKDKLGNVAEINLMMTAMLRHAGFNANPVLLSTRDNGIALFPNRSAFNYVIASVETDKGIILMDATDPYAIPNILPVRNLNWNGRLMRKDGTSAVVDLMPQRTSKEGVNVAYKIEPDGSVSGKCRRQITDHMALSYRSNTIGLNLDQFLENLENKNDKIEINDYQRENEKDLGKPYVESYAFKSANVSDVIGDKIYLSPLLFLKTDTNPFKQENREYPMDFAFPSEYKYNINIEIPEGYVIESLPQQLNLATEEKIGTFKYVISGTGSKIQIMVTTNLNMPVVPPAYYLTIKDFFQKMVDKENEKIVLKKA